MWLRALNLESDRPLMKSSWLWPPNSCAIVRKSLNFSNPQFPVRKVGKMTHNDSCPTREVHCYLSKTKPSAVHRTSVCGGGGGVAGGGAKTGAGCTHGKATAGEGQCVDGSGAGHQPTGRG